MKVPCRGCVDRTIRCHAYCERYLAFKKEQEEIFKKKCEEADLTDYLVKKIEQTKKVVGMK